MGTRSDITEVEAPYPVVFDALVASLPTAGFRITGVDADRGRITADTRNTTFEIAVGAIDAITTEWVATGELKFGLFRNRHENHFQAMADALGRYLITYYA